MACIANASVIGEAFTEIKDSIAWTRASIPLAAVIDGGQLTVNSGATIATSGNK